MLLWFWALTATPTQALPRLGHLVRDINPGEKGSNPDLLGIISGALVFTADDGEHGVELWRSDGTSDGTRLIRDIYPGAQSGIGYGGAAVFNHFLAFGASDGVDAAQLWRSDGTEGGTVPVHTFPTQPRLLTTVGNQLWFMVAFNFYGDLRGSDVLFSSDLSELGTAPLSNLGYWEPGFSGGAAMVRSITPYQDGALIARKDEFECCEQSLLQRVGRDGNPTSCALYSAMGGHLHPLYPVTPLVAGDVAYFTTADSYGTYGCGLWRTRGSPENTVQLQIPDAGCGLSPLSVLGSDLLLSRTEADGHLKLYRATATQDSVALVADLDRGFVSYEAGSVTISRFVYFVLRRFDADELWRIDTDSANLALVYRFVGNGTPAGYVRTLMQAGDAIMFWVGDFSDGGSTLWRSGGTAESTHAVGSVAPGVRIAGSLVSGNTVFVSAGDIEHGYELWNLDLSAPEPQCVGDCNGDGVVTIDEIVLAVSLALDESMAGCAAVDANSDVQVTVDEILAAVDHALRGCHACTGPACQPPVSLELQLERTETSVQVAARLTNHGEDSVYYLSGCSAQCRPFMYQPISFRVTGPDGKEVVVKSSGYPYPCGGACLGPEGPAELRPGQSLDDVLKIDGTAWQLGDRNNDCQPCTAVSVTPGRYTVTAETLYSFAASDVYRPSGHVQKTVDFDWAESQ
ncbi:MAG: hypothetical protein HY270_00735 [Deltaproteobacteria bacterium]|nr:hypothetical protein [Deltaproteobacteria bacterium]